MSYVILITLDILYNRFVGDYSWDKHVVSCIVMSQQNGEFRGVVSKYLKRIVLEWRMKWKKKWFGVERD